MRGIRSKISVFIFLSAFLLSVPFVFSPGRALAGDVEILLDELVNEGIITKEGAQKIEKKIKERKEKEQEKVEKEKVEGEKTTAEKAKVEKKESEPEWVKNIPEWVKNPPDWVRKIKFSGDLVLRYDYTSRENLATSASPDITRNRGRFRLRIGAETQIMNNVTVGFGLATGESANSRSMFQTFNGAFNKKPININYAYVAYTPFNWLTVSGGKLKTNPVFRANSTEFTPSDLLWDNNITPEGVAVIFNYPSVLNLDAVKLDLFMNNAFFVLDEASNGREPYMFIFQPGFNVKFLKDFNLKAAAGYYQFNGIRGKTELGYSTTSGIQPAPGDSNTLIKNLISAGPPKVFEYLYAFNYNSFNISAELGYMTPLADLMPYVGLFGEYVDNLNTNYNNLGWTVGGRIGYPTLKKFGDWQLSYCYRRIERDAELDFFPDANFYQGQTNVKGHKTVIFFALTKNIISDLYWAHTVNIGGLKQPEDRLLIETMFKF